MDINTKRTRTTISIVMLIWAVVCIAVTGLYVGNNHAEAATTGTLTSDYVYFRKSPNGTPIKYNGSAILLRKGQKMTVLSTSNKTWYKVKLTYKKKSYTGYVYSAYIKVTKTTTKKAHLRKNENYVYFRKTPNGTPLKYNGSPIMLMGGQSMTVLSTSNKTWYKVKLTYKKKSYTGYVYSKFIVIDSNSATTKATTKATTQQPTTAAQTAKSGYVNEDYVYFRQTAAGTPITYNGSAIMLMKGQALSVTDTSNKSWYKVNLTYSSKKYTGYISSSLITMGTYKEPDGNQTSDAAFEKQLSAQNFPESYKVLLRKLHAEHPNWVFKAVHTNLDWNDVVKNEVNVQGRVNNLVNCTSSSPNYGWRSQTVGYNYKTDSYSSYDGSTWFAASDDLVKYYLDPRTYMSSASSMFAFEKLSYDSSQTKSGVEAILSGSFMHNAHPTGSTTTYSSMIITAAQKSGVSPYHIASRIKQEVGGSITSGTNGKNATYPGIYNFYNIGAFESASGNAITNGLRWASSGTSYNRPWTTPAKSIIGGAMYIGESYINKGQNTLYTQKFNVTYTDCLYWHQYMGNVQAPTTEAWKVYDAYKSSGALNKAITFAIPVYKNMPSTAMKMPAANPGNQNNYLKTLSVSGQKLSPTFAISNTTQYTVNVSSSVSSVTINASPVSSYSTVSGTGTKTLKSGKNTFKIVCKSQSKATRTYTIIINRG